METNKVLDLNGQQIVVGTDGKCIVNTKEATIRNSDIDYNNVNYTIRTNVDGAIHMYMCANAFLLSGALYISKPTLYANGTEMVEINKKLSSYITNTVTFQVGTEIDKICNNTVNTFSSFAIDSYSVNGVLDNVLYFTGNGNAKKQDKSGNSVNLDVKIDFCINMMDGTINSNVTMNDVALQSKTDDNKEKIVINIGGWGGTGNADMDMRSFRGALLGN